jgi:ABC-2 type transport system permease protein
MKVGTLPWIVRHELRLWWREITVRPVTIFILVSFAILPLTWVWFTLGNLRDTKSFQTIPDTAFWIAVVVWLFGFYYGFIQAMRSSLMGLFERGDLDLLVSSPISSKVIFASRVLAIALKTFCSGCLFVIPLSLIAVLFGVPQLLGLYPALIGISLSATSLAMLFVLVLVRVVGAKRARTFAQVLTALFPITIYLSSQLPNLLQGSSNIESIWFRLEQLLASGNFLSADSWVWFPARAIFFDPLSVVLVLIISSGLTWVTVEILHSSFLAGTQQELTSKHRQLRPTEATRFVGGFYRVALLKEWRIMRRNPYLISRIFLQMFFLAFPFLSILRQNHGHGVDLLTLTWPMTLVIGGALTSILTQICVSGEEAPDLLKSSPVDSGKLRQLKLLAALIPIWLFMSPLFIVLIVNSKSWFMAIVVFLAGTTCAATLSMWNSRPVKLTELFRRRQNSQVDVLLKLLEIISWLSWAWLGFSLQQGNISTILMSLAMISLVVALAYGRSRQLGTLLGF